MGEIARGRTHAIGRGRVGERRRQPRIHTPGLKAWVVSPRGAYRYDADDLSLSGIALAPGPLLPHGEVACNIVQRQGKTLRLGGWLSSVDGKRQGLEFREMSDDDAIRLEKLLQRFAPWVHWGGRIWIAGDVALDGRERNALQWLTASGFSIDHDRTVTHLPDDTTTTDIIVSARRSDLADAVLEVRSALPRRRVVGHESGSMGVQEDVGAFLGGASAAVCSACHGSDGLVVSGRVPLLCNSCLAVGYGEQEEAPPLYLLS